jgi:hypothetical protein
MIFEPEERRCTDLAKLADEAASSEALLSAAMFVLITILTPSMSHPLRGFVVL